VKIVGRLAIAGTAAPFLIVLSGEVLSVDKLAGHQDGVTFPALCAGLV